MGRVCLYILPLQPDFQGSSQDQRGQNTQSHSHHTALDGGSMVPDADEHVHPSTSGTESFNLLSSSAPQTNTHSPSSAIETDGLSLIREMFKRKGSNKKLTKFLMKGWKSTSLNQYNVYLKRWILFCKEHNVNPLDRDNILALNFLRKLYNQGYSHSAISTAKSALSSIFGKEKNLPAFGQTDLTIRFMKSVYNSRPSLPRYHATWDVAIVLRYLDKYSPARFLLLQQLTPYWH